MNDSYSNGVIGALREEGIRRIVYVPDSVLSPILHDAAGVDDFKLVSASREEEAVAITAGSAIGGERAILMMQSSGLGNALNVLGSLVLPMKLPCPIVLSLRGEIGDRNYAQVPWSSVALRAAEMMGIVSSVISEGQRAQTTVAEVIRSAYRWSMPTMAVLTRSATGGVDD